MFSLLLKNDKMKVKTEKNEINYINSRHKKNRLLWPPLAPVSFILCLDFVFSYDDRFH